MSPQVSSQIAMGASTILRSARGQPEDADAAGPGQAKVGGGRVAAWLKPILLNLAKLWLSAAMTAYYCTTPASSLRS